MYAGICPIIQLVSSIHNRLIVIVVVYTNIDHYDCISLAYFNEFAGEWGQIFHRGKDSQLKFVKHVENIMIQEDNNGLNGCSYIGVETIFNDWNYYTNNNEL